MRILYKQEVGRVEGRYAVVNREGSEPSYCCQEMEAAYGVLFAFGSQRPGDERVYLITTYFLDSDESVSCPEPVRFCPFCGARIEAVEAVEAID